MGITPFWEVESIHFELHPAQGEGGTPGLSHPPDTPLTTVITKTRMSNINYYTRARDDERQAKCSLGVRMYVINAELDQRPNAWIVESGTPASAAAVAAPIRKLCPEYPAVEMPARDSADRTISTKRDFVKGTPSAVQKKAPWAEPRRAA